MARIEKTVFISYRRTDVYTALAVYENLKNQGYDVFFDYRSISSGDFEQIITSNIRARAHFLLILTPTALDRCNEPGDWLRREIEFAMDERRNIIPLFFRGFRFGDPSLTGKLTGKLLNVSRYNGLNVHEDYFDEAMHRLRTQYLNIPLNTVLHPVSTEVQKVVREEQVAADKALEQLENVQDLVKPDEAKTELEKLESQAIQFELIGDLWNALQTYYEIRRIDPFYPRLNLKIEELEREEQLKRKVTPAAPREEKPAPLRLIGLVAAGLLVIALLIWGAANFLQNLPQATSEPMGTVSPTLITATQTSITLTQPGIPATSDGDVDSPVRGKDDMILLYVPAGDFNMGTDVASALSECQKVSSVCEFYAFSEEGPQHRVSLDAFWIDETEVTNAMFAKCVQDGGCNVPGVTNSETRPEYYGNSQFNNYPVVAISWESAQAYCTWANRRLPTEAEWEKAARGENSFVYPWGNNFNDGRVNFCDSQCPWDWADQLINDEFADTSPVGNYPQGASPYGAMDMAGNVWEWVADWYSDTYDAGMPASNPTGPDSGIYRVLRGGSYFDSAVSLRTTVRSSVASVAYKHIGFRCATDAP